MRARSAASRVLELDMTTGMPAVRGSAQLLQHCESARGRHEQVEQDEVRLFVAGKSEAFDSVGGLDDLGALPREQLPQQVARDFLVVDEQHLAQNDLRPVSVCSRSRSQRRSTGFLANALVPRERAFCPSSTLVITSTGMSRVSGPAFNSAS